MLNGLTPLYIYIHINIGLARRFVWVFPSHLMEKTPVEPFAWPSKRRRGNSCWTCLWHRLWWWFPGCTLASLMAQRLKRLPAMRETRVRSLGQEDPLEKEMATHSSILAWRITWMEEAGRLQSMGSQRVGHDWATSLSLFTFTLILKKIVAYVNYVQLSVC